MFSVLKTKKKKRQAQNCIKVWTCDYFQKILFDKHFKYLPIQSKSI